MDSLLNVLSYVGLWLLAFIVVAVAYNIAEKYLKIYQEKIDTMFTPEQWDMAERFAYILVRAAEQVFGIDGSGEEKMEYVLDLLSKRFPSLDKEMLRAIIESMVKNYKTMRTDLLED